MDTHWRYLILYCARIVAFTAGALFLVCGLSACQPLAPGTGTQSLPGPYHQGGKRYVIDADNSQIRLLVYRDGPLARLGHNHVITGRVSGEVYVAEQLADSGFRLQIPVDSFVVDLPGPRSEEGNDFSATVTDSAREGTRHNLLGEALLDAAQFPLIEVESTRLEGSPAQPQVSARILLHGTMQTLQFPAQVQLVQEQLVIIASFRVLQSGLGLQPFSILGGALRVRDAVDIRARIVARRQSGDG